MFGAIIFLGVTLMHLYVFWRAGSVPFLRRRFSRKVLFGAGGVFWSVFCFGLFSGHSPGMLSGTLGLLGMDWMAVMFLATVCLLAVDLLTGFGLLLRAPAPSLRGLALVAAGVLSMTAVVQGLRPPVVQRYEVQLPGLPRQMDGTVVVAMSDMHVGTLLDRRWLEGRIAQVRAERPDLVVLLGDIFEGHGRPENELIEVLHGLSAPMGVWAVLGNHEFHGNDPTGAPLMNIDGVRVLGNSWAEVRPGLILAGVDDLTANHGSGSDGEAVSEALGGRPAGATILLSHTPWQAEKAAAEGTGLMLSGHTHGGQIWPFGYLVRRIYPLFEGSYDVNGMTVIICRGTGTWGPRMRLWRPAEILRVTLRAAPERPVNGET